ncbi:apolipoprotein N-acyltransferase [Novosphingobium malaysiense]|uniref:Apolipoprotein N-acyltransferase n=1 Tax=Novosphingobium malaysiense TaxID=1348853 RepID=A0A0B1ZJI4_9SPHN|nr:apolipoprotein N-acyltransferase [Novosphingobium malaysiense]KHK89492.1 acyltransferase [Novosphingobium malaysiense]
MQSDRRAPVLSQALSPAVRYPRIAAIAFGALAACGFQPLALWPLTLIAIACLLELVARTVKACDAFLIGWFFGLGHFTLGDNWIATAFTYQANMPAWLGGIAVVLLSLYLAIFPALATMAAWLLVRPDKAKGRGGGFAALAFAFASAWIVTEWVRAWLFTGFAWNPLGVALLGRFDARGLALVTPWIGTYGLSGLLVLLSGLPGLFGRLVARGRSPLRWLWTVPVLALAAGLGVLMIVPDPWARPEEGSIRFTLIQPDLRQEIIDDPRYFEANFRKMARLSLPRKPGEKRVVFWPESGLGDYLRDGYPRYLYRLYTYGADPVIARERIGRVIGPYGLLLAGAVDLVIENGDEVAARNSVTVINGRGDIVAGYSKAHLVPYGEYLPLRWLLEPLGASRLVAGALDFRPGPGPRSYDFGDWGEAGVQICYEIVFSGEVVDPFNRPDYIYNPSNDGWFGTWGPPQHLAQARLRAIEEGLPILRSTTTGISAVIDANGIVRSFIPWRQAGRIDGRIPPPHEPTLFSRYGNALPLAFAALIALAAVSMVALSRRRR